MGLTRFKFGKQQNCDSIRGMTISGVTVTGVYSINSLDHGGIEPALTTWSKLKITIGQHPYGWYIYSMSAIAYLN